MHWDCDLAWPHWWPAGCAPVPPHSHPALWSPLSMSHSSLQLFHSSVLAASSYMSCVNHLTVGAKNIVSHFPNMWYAEHTFIQLSSCSIISAFVSATFYCSHTPFPFVSVFPLFAGCCFVTFYTRKAALEAQNALHNIKTLSGVSKHSMGCF